MGEQLCNGCGETKPQERFSWANKAEGKRHTRCKDCAKAATKRWYDANREELVAKQRARYAADPEKVNRAKRERHDPERVRGTRIKAKYGITVEQYNEMLERQGEVCAICRREETRTRLGTLRGLCVDHDHETGAVRGLLCASCNSGIAYLGDDSDRLAAAIEYLAAAQRLQESTESLVKGRDHHPQG